MTSTDYKLVEACIGWLCCPQAFCSLVPHCPRDTSLKRVLLLYIKELQMCCRLECLWPQVLFSLVSHCSRGVCLSRVMMLYMKELCM